MTSCEMALKAALITADKDVVAAFRDLHACWLTADHRSDMNREMDALAVAIGLDPYTLEAIEEAE